MEHKYFGILLIIASILIMIFSQLMFKQRLSLYGIMPLNLTELIPYIVQLSKDWRVWVAGIGLILSALFWYAAVSRVPLSFAFPIAAMSYPLIMLSAVLFLQESITAPKIIANLLIVSGVLVLGFSNSN